MKRWIRSNSEIGHYKGIRYGMEDDGDQRYYFVKDDGEVVYAELEDELYSKIDEYLDDYEEVESATSAACSCNIRYLTYDQVKSMLIRALAKHDRNKIAELQRSKFYDDVVSDMKSAMRVTASQEIMLARI